jgi:L-aminopeptidase/D-esterase-like protein
MAGFANLITDLPGLAVGHAQDPRLASGVTVALFDEPAVASIAIHGFAPGVRDTALLEAEMTVDRVDALAISGGSSFGLDAMGGVLALLREQGRGFLIGDVRVPIVPGAILFDLLNGGDKNWGRTPPYWELGFAAAKTAARDFPLGSCGAGLGANTANLKGGLGSASAVTSNGYRVGALVAVNSLGQTTIGDSPHFWAAPFERGVEYGGLGWPNPTPGAALEMRLQSDRLDNTTVAIVATDAPLTKAEAKRLAVQAHDGMAHALRPAHGALDGDIVFSASTARNPRPLQPRDLAEIGMIVADTLARAIARGVYEATALPFDGALPAWRDLYSKT